MLKNLIRADRAFRDQLTGVVCASGAQTLEREIRPGPTALTLVITGDMEIHMRSISSIAAWTRLQIPVSARRPTRPTSRLIWVT